MRMTRIEKTALLIAAGMFGFCSYYGVKILYEGEVPTLQRVRDAVRSNREALEAIRMHFARQVPAGPTFPIVRQFDDFGLVEWAEVRYTDGQRLIHGQIHPTGGAIEFSSVHLYWLSDEVAARQGPGRAIGPLGREWHHIEGNWWAHFDIWG